MVAKGPLDKSGFPRAKVHWAEEHFNKAAEAGVGSSVLRPAQQLEEGFPKKV